MNSRRCSKCRQTKLLADFHSNGPGKYRSACKECEKVRDTQRRPTVPRPPAQTREQLLANARERDRARRAAAAALRPPKPAPNPPRVKVGRYGPAPGLLTLNCITLTRTQWAKRLGLAGATSIISREDLGWTLGRTLDQEVVFKNQKAAVPLVAAVTFEMYLTHGGIIQSLRDWAKDKGCHPATIRGRLKLGWTVARALDTPLRPYKLSSEVTDHNPA